MSERESIDWLAVEADYRPNKLSLREIGAKYGCTEGAIRKKAKKEGWTRDLSEKIKSKADDLVRREAVRTEYAASTEKEIVEANAINNAAIQINERRDVTKARNIVMNLFDELEHQVNNKELYEKLGEILQSSDAGAESKLNDIYRKVISFGGRVGSAKQLSESLKSLIDLERRVYKIDDNGSGDTFEDWLRRQPRE